LGNRKGTTGKFQSAQNLPARTAQAEIASKPIALGEQDAIEAKELDDKLCKRIHSEPASSNMTAYYHLDSMLSISRGNASRSWQLADAG
jgi:hypothetical protein